MEEPKELLNEPYIGNVTIIEYSAAAVPVHPRGNGAQHISSFLRKIDENDGHSMRKHSA